MLQRDYKLTLNSDQNKKEFNPENRTQNKIVKEAKTDIRQQSNWNLSNMFLVDQCLSLFDFWPFDNW